MAMIGIDLFAGVGGMSHGAISAGIDVQLVIEADQKAAETYQLNHQPSVNLFNNDIRKFSFQKLDRANHEQLIIFGGPPCQGFSTSNQKTRNSDNQNNWLFQEFIRIVQLYSPEWIVFENVKGILETEKGKFAKLIINSFEKLGYKCESAVLNALHYGVPQHRERFFIVASRNSNNFSFPEKKYHESHYISVHEAFIDLPSLENGSSDCKRKYKVGASSSYSQLMRKNHKGSFCHNNLVTKNAQYIIERYKYIPQGGNWENIPDDLMLNYKDKSRCHTGIYHRLDANLPSVVIGNYRKNMLIHPYKNRGLSVREAARLQSFPDSFIFTGSIGFQQQQVGNAVPPVLAQSIFENIINHV